MQPWRLYSIVFIEGFCSLGAEVIALRRLTPHIGSSIVVTAPTIAFFLLALALGYAAGAKVSHHYLEKVSNNFLVAATLAGVGLSAILVDGLFAGPTAMLAYLIFIGGVLCPLAWLLGQTVPILTNLMAHERAGEASGTALYWSTLGSFLGSITLSLLIMQWLGVSAAVFVCALGLVAGALLLNPQPTKTALVCTVVTVLSAASNLPRTVTADTAYAQYDVIPIELPSLKEGRAFLVNHSTASIIDDSSPPNYTRYIQHVRKTLLEDLGFRDKSILVLGAGGFTLSHREPLNRYTFVDIDPKIKAIAEAHFLREPAQGTFIVDDARHFLLDTAQRDQPFDAMLVDVFSTHTAIPSHLVTQEFWAITRQALAPEGVLMVNLILDGKLESPLARNLLATIESIYGRCAIEVLHKAKPLSNVEVTCFATSHFRPAQRYIDEKNGAEMDMTSHRP